MLTKVFAVIFTFILSSSVVAGPKANEYGELIWNDEDTIFDQFADLFDASLLTDFSGIDHSDNNLGRLVTHDAPNDWIDTKIKVLVENTPFGIKYYATSCYNNGRTCPVSRTRQYLATPDTTNQSMVVQESDEHRFSYREYTTAAGDRFVVCKWETSEDSAWTTNGYLYFLVAE